MGLAVCGGLADADALARAAGFAPDIVSALLFFTCSCAVYAKVQHALNNHLPAVAFPVFLMRARRHAPGRSRCSPKGSAPPGTSAWIEGVPRLRPQSNTRRSSARRSAPEGGRIRMGEVGRCRGACLRQRRGAGDRRGAAADVRGALFRVPPQPQHGDLGRSRNDGLRASGRHRRQAGRPRPRGSASSRATAGCR